MTITDPIVDMLARLRNTPSAYHKSVSMPYSKMKAAIASILQTESYIKGYQVEGAQVDKTLVLNLKYGIKRRRATSDVKRVSKPGLRAYAKFNKLPKTMGGLGVAITPSSFGLLTDRGVADKGVGGEIIAYIW